METRHLLNHERSLWSSGYELIAGVDEVGRGALAGPLVAAAVVLPSDQKLIRRSRAFLDQVRDSKSLTPMARSRLAPQVVEFARDVSIGIVEVEELDELGLAAANRMAMERAVGSLSIDVSVLLLDAATTDLGLPQIGLIDGDALSLSIAAASIVAKVTRDRMMEDIHEVDARYGFSRHKGYGTADHLAAIESFGLCWCHRKSFRPCSTGLDAD